MKSDNLRYLGKGANLLYIQANCQGYSDEIQITDYWYKIDTITSDELTPNIELPSQFKIEFNLHPNNRSTSSGGNSAYIRLGETSSTGIWVGQGTSSGSHGLMPRGKNSIWCPTTSILSVDNPVTVIYDGNTITYTCNNETVNTTISNLTKLNGIIGTVNHRLNSIKITKL